jgi:hypothetical protein
VVVVEQVDQLVVDQIQFFQQSHLLEEVLQVVKKVQLLIVVNQVVQVVVEALIHLQQLMVEQVILHL